MPRFAEQAAALFNPNLAERGKGEEGADECPHVSVAAARQEAAVPTLRGVVRSCRMAKLEYERQPPPPGGSLWHWPGWAMALAWLPICLLAAYAGAYYAAVAFWGEFRGEAQCVVPRCVGIGGGLAALFSSPVSALARLTALQKVALAILVALLATFAITLLSLYALWGP